MSENAGNITSTELTSSSGATHVRKTATPGTDEHDKRRSALNSSVLLMSVARALFSGRIRRSCDQMHLGLGGGSEEPWSSLDMLCCPSDSEPVVLGLAIRGTACFCLGNIPTPCARDWKGKGRQWSIPSMLVADFNGSAYPHPTLYENVMGFPIMWSELEPSATP